MVWTPQLPRMHKLAAALPWQVAPQCSPAIAQLHGGASGVKTIITWFMRFEKSRATWKNLYCVLDCRWSLRPRIIGQELHEALERVVAL